jgi:hypothetical protein
MSLVNFATLCSFHELLPLFELIQVIKVSCRFTDGEEWGSCGGSQCGRTLAAPSHPSSSADDTVPTTPQDQVGSSHLAKSPGVKVFLVGDEGAREWSLVGHAEVELNQKQKRNVKGRTRPCLFNRREMRVGHGSCNLLRANDNQWLPPQIKA